MSRHKYYIVESGSRRVLGFAQTRWAAIDRASKFGEDVDIELENEVIAKLVGGKVLVPKKKPLVPIPEPVQEPLPPPKKTFVVRRKGVV